MEDRPSFWQTLIWATVAGIILHGLATEDFPDWAWMIPAAILGGLIATYFSTDRDSVDHPPGPPETDQKTEDRDAGQLVRRARKLRP